MTGEAAAIAAYARDATLIDPDPSGDGGDLDAHLREVTDKTAGTLFLDWPETTHLAALCELLAAVAALRAALGLAPSPTGKDIMRTWQSRGCPRDVAGIEAALADAYAALGTGD